MSLRGRMMHKDFVKGLPYRDELRSIKNAYTGAVTPTAERMQQALVNLLSKDGTSTGALERFAGSDDALMLLKALPVAGAVGGVMASDLVDGEAGFGNIAMDTLGMGAGTAFGYQRGKVGRTTPAGQAMHMLGGALAGLAATNLGQGIVGGLS